MEGTGKGATRLAAQVLIHSPSESAQCYGYVPDPIIASCGTRV